MEKITMEKITKLNIKNFNIGSISRYDARIGHINAIIDDITVPDFVILTNTEGGEPVLLTKEDDLYNDRYRYKTILEGNEAYLQYDSDNNQWVVIMGDSILAYSPIDTENEEEVNSLIPKISGWYTGRWSNLQQEEETVPVQFSFNFVDKMELHKYIENLYGGITDLSSQINNLSSQISDLGGGASPSTVYYNEVVSSGVLFGLMNSNSLTEGMQYYTSDTNMVFRALSTDKLSTQVEIVSRIVKHVYYYEGQGVTTLGVWNHTLGTPSIGDVAIWGGKVWTNLTGNLGVASDIYSLDGNWESIPKDNDTYYQTKVFNGVYNFEYNALSVQSDDRGNVFTSNTFDYQNVFPICDWGNELITNNRCYGIYNNIGGSTYNDVRGSISGNGVPNILNNRCASIDNNVGSSITNNILSGDIRGNNVFAINNNVAEYIVDNNIPNNFIIGNIIRGSIELNTCQGVSHNNNNGRIGNNSCGSVNNNSNNGDIYNNANSGDISRNKNNGSIHDLNSGVTDVVNNTNNGEIGTSVVGPISDTVVDK